MVYVLDEVAPEVEEKCWIIAAEVLYRMVLEHPCHLLCYVFSTEVGTYTLEYDVIFCLVLFKILVVIHFSVSVELV